MKIRALVSHYVTMNVDTNDIDTGCRLIRKAVQEEDPALIWEKPTLDYPEVLGSDSDVCDDDHAYEEARDRVFQEGFL